MVRNSLASKSTGDLDHSPQDGFGICEEIANKKEGSVVSTQVISQALQLVLLMGINECAQGGFMVLSLFIESAEIKDTERDDWYKMIEDHHQKIAEKTKQWEKEREERRNIKLPVPNTLDFAINNGQEKWNEKTRYDLALNERIYIGQQLMGTIQDTLKKIK